MEEISLSVGQRSQSKGECVSLMGTSSLTHASGPSVRWREGGSCSSPRSERVPKHTTFLSLRPSVIRSCGLREKDGLERQSPLYLIILRAVRGCGALIGEAVGRERQHLPRHLMEV